MHGPIRNTRGAIRNGTSDDRRCRIAYHRVRWRVPDRLPDLIQPQPESPASRGAFFVLSVENGPKIGSGILVQLEARPFVIITIVTFDMREIYAALRASQRVNPQSEKHFEGDRILGLDDLGRFCLQPGAASRNNISKLDLPALRIFRLDKSLAHALFFDFRHLVWRKITPLYGLPIRSSANSRHPSKINFVTITHRA